MRDRGRCDEDPFHWAFRHSYGRKPSEIELARYKFGTRSGRWLSPDEFAELELAGEPGPWEAWPTRPIPSVDRKPVSPVESGSIPEHTPAPTVPIANSAAASGQARADRCADTSPEADSAPVGTPPKR